MRRYRGGKMALDVQHAMRTELFDSLSRLDGARQDEIHTGQLVGRSISDLNMVQGLLQWMPLTLGSVFLFVFSLVIMIALSPPLALVAVAVAPALWLISTAARKKLFPASWHAQQQVGEVAGIVDEAIGGVRVVKGFGQEDQEMRRMEAASEDLFGSRLRMIRSPPGTTPRSPRSRRSGWSACSRSAAGWRSTARSRSAPSSLSPATWHSSPGRCGCSPAW